MHLVLFALLERGGNERFVSTDEVAIEAFRLFPGKFCWDEHPHLPHWDRVRQWLSEAKKAKHGALVEGYSGDRRDGWRLTAEGVRLMRFKERAFDEVECGPVAEEDYRDVGKGLLVAASLSELAESNKTPDFPNLVSCSYSRFPVAFELPRHEGWPDSSLVREGIEEAISDGLIRPSSNAQQWELTEQGGAQVTSVRDRGGRSTPRLRLAEIGKGLATKAAQSIASITKTRAWLAHEAGSTVTRASACEAIRCTLQSHPNAIRRALEQYFADARDLGRKDVEAFLQDCSEVIGISIRATESREEHLHGQGTEDVDQRIS